MSSDLENNNKPQDEYIKIAEFELLRTLIHDLTKPLINIQMNISNILNERIPPDQIEKKLWDMNAMVEKIRRVLKNLDLFIKPDNVSIRSISKERFSVKNFINSLVFDFKEQAKSEGLEIIVKYTEYDSNDMFETDEALLEQILASLIDNAIRYSYPKNKLGAHILIEYKLSNEALQLKIVNRSYPVRSKEIKDLFERGYRDPFTMKNSPIGAGIGLYVVKICVEALKGVISITSQNNEFSVLLKFPR